MGYNIYIMENQIEVIDEEKFFRKCSYRNCGKSIEHKRRDAKYCDRNCKTCEQKYRKRKAILIEKYKQKELEKVKQYKELVKVIKGKDKN